MINGTGMPKVDGRGKHNNRPNRTPNDVLECVKTHINLFPTYQSHYSRRDNINRVYLGEDLSIGRMHKLYLERSEENEWPRVSVDAYRRIFCENFNMRFRLPQTDTCKVCDKFSIDMQAASEEDRLNLEQQWNSHKEKAKAAFELLRRDTQMAKENPTEFHVICFDLQQALPTPKLSSSPAFYKRKLWTYNFCIHNMGADTASMFMWPETTAGRGSSEVASCILQYFKNDASVNARRLIVYSDNCSGQNKNINMLSLWQYLIAQETFTEVTHKFPVSGHTMMPCDRDFGDIERKMRKRRCIYAPSEYVELVKECRTKNQFKVTEMTTDKFVSLDSVAKMMTKRTITSDKEKIDFRQVCQFRMSSNKPLSVEVKLSHDDSEQWKLISFQKRGRPVKLQDVQLLPLYNGPKHIAKAKVDDVKSLCVFIPPIHHDFYNNIVVSEQNSGAEPTELMDDGSDVE